MSGKTRIVVLHMKEVVYTVIFLILAVVLAVLLFLMFGSSSGQDADASSGAVYQPGVYTSSIQLNDNIFDVEVTVDPDHIKSIRMVNLSEITTAMFPLMEPTLEELAAQIYVSQSVEDVVYSEDNKYTSMLLLNAIEDALSKARTE